MKPPKDGLLEILDRHARPKWPYLSDDAVLTVRQEVTKYYESWRPPTRDQDEIRLSVSLRGFRGWSTLPAAVSTWTDADIEGAEERYPGDGHTLHMLRRTVMGPLLYADQFVDQDPLSFEKYFGLTSEQRASRGLDYAIAARVRDALGNIFQVRPLIESGHLILAPLEDQNLPTAEQDEEEGYRAFLRERLGEHGESMYRNLGRWEFRDALRTANATDSTLVPQYEWEWHYMEFLLKQGVARGADPARVAAGLITLELPLLGGVPAKTLVSIHRNEEAFADWRRSLRTATRLINAECSDVDFAKHAKSIYEDLIISQTEALKKSTSRSKALKSIVRDQPLRMVLGATYGLAGSLTLGLPPAGTIAGTVAATLANISYAALHREKPKGAAAVISMLQKHSR